MRRSVCLITAILSPCVAFAQTTYAPSDFTPLSSAQAATAEDRMVSEADGEELILAPELRDQPRAINGQEDR
jgi:TolA-binding protein